MTECTMKDTVTLEDAAKVIGIKKDVLEHHIENGRIHSYNGVLSNEVCTRILEQKQELMSLKDFLMQYENGVFQPTLISHRNKYVDFLEEYRYFGVQVHEPEEILFEVPRCADPYISKEDAMLLGVKSVEFFREFGLTEEEKVNRLISQDRDHPVARKYIRDYLAIVFREGTYTPATTDFIRIIFHIPDLKKLTDVDVTMALEETDSCRSKESLIGFLTYVAQREKVRYHDIHLKKKEAEERPAYSYEDFIGLAILLFNEEYDKEHGLTEKALENHLYAETWMFLACHYVCGWRAADICNRWVYPCFDGNDNHFGIKIDTLKEDILNQTITEQDYDRIALYVLRKIDLANNIPQKTGHGKLRSEIVPELRKFFGKLTLIAEYHHAKSGEGYMVAHRIAYYRNWITGRNFFGDRYLKIFGRYPIQSVRLNKSYLQGIEQAARENGSTVLTAHVVAAYARSHANVNTTAIYLRDHGLTGESADLVLYMMMQRGVFSVSLYTALLTAFPGAFEKLTAKEQTQIMEKIPLTAYELETVGLPLLASDRMAEEFTAGKADSSGEILKAMFAITQGKGKAKETGVWCIRRALGFSCDNPTYTSCIANLCPYHIFTRDGIIPLINVIKGYQKKALETGNAKYRVALERHIIPAFQHIINELLKEMEKQEKMELRRLIEEVLNEPQDS